MRFAHLAVLVALGIGAAAPAAAAPHLVRTLPNKMNVVIRENRTRPLASVQVWIHAGSRDEGRSERGAAAVLAHLPYEETATRKRLELPKEVQSFGGTYGSESDYQSIMYQMTVPARHVGRAIDILSDAVIRPAFNQYTVDQALAKARRESRGALGTASGASLNPVRSALYGDTPLGAPQNVPELEIGALTQTILQRFYQENFVAQNATVFVVGDVEAEEVAAKIAQAFQDMPRGKARSKPRLKLKDISGPVVRWVNAPADAQGSAVTAGFRAPAWGSADALALDVLMALLVDAPGSRLERRLQEGPADLGAALAYRSMGEDGGMVALSLTADAARLSDAEGVLVQEIEKVRAQPMTEDETAAAVRSVIARDLSSLTELWGLGRALALGYYQGRIGADEVVIQRLRAIRPEDLTAVARKYLDWKNAAVVGMGPSRVADSLDLDKSFEKTFRERLSLYQGTYRGGPQATASADEVRRARIDQPLASVAAAPFDPGRGRVARAALPGGIRLLTSEDHSAPSVTVAVYLAGGVRFENEKNNGITSLMRESMLNLNDPKRTNLTYRQTLGLMGSFVPYQDRDMWGISLAVPASDWKEALGKIGSMLATSDLDSTTVDATRILLLTALDRWREDDEAQRQRLIFATKYEVSGYRLPGLGTSTNLISMPLESIQAWHRKFVVKPNLVVAVFGDVASSEVAPAVEQAFRDVKAGPFAPGRPPMDLPFEGFREKWELGAGPVTTVQLAFNGPPAGSPEMPIFYVVNSLLSGPRGWFAKYMETESIINDASSIVAQSVDESPIIASLTLQGTVNEEESVKLLFRQFKKVAGLELVGPELEEDFRNAKTHAVGVYHSAFTSNTSRAFQWARAEVFGLPQDYVLTLPSRMESVTQQDLLRVGKRYFQNDDWVKAPYAIAETRPGGW